MNNESSKTSRTLFINSVKTGILFYLKKLIPFISYITLFTFFFFPSFLKEILTSPLARWNWIVMWSQFLLIPAVIYTIYKVFKDKKTGGLNETLV